MPTLRDMYKGRATRAVLYDKPKGACTVTRTRSGAVATVVDRARGTEASRAIGFVRPFAAFKLACYRGVWAAMDDSERRADAACPVDAVVEHVEAQVHHPAGCELVPDLE